MFRIQGPRRSGLRSAVTHRGTSMNLLEPSRRAVMTGIAATIAASAIAPARTSGKEAPGLAYRSAGELGKMLVDRKVSSRELVDAAITRIEALDGKINAVVVRDFERARA